MPNINDIKYDQKTLTNPTLVVNSIPNETEILQSYTQTEINSQTYPLSTRNVSGVYIVPVTKDIVWLNYLAQKTVIKDSELFNVIDNQFKYFIKAPVIEVTKFTLNDGTFFRCASDTLKSVENYTYYLMKDGKASIIPNFKTLEVMLVERGQSMLSVKVLEQNQCKDIDKTGMDETDKQTQWTSDLSDLTNVAKFKALGDSVKSSAAVVEGAKAEAQKQIDAVKEQAVASQKEADASKAQATAAKAASDAAIAQAKAAEAAANAAAKEAEAAKAQADQAKAEAEASKTTK